MPSDRWHDEGPRRTSLGRSGALGGLRHRKEYLMNITIDIDSWSPEQVADLVRLTQGNQAQAELESLDLDPERDVVPDEQEWEEAPDTGWTPDSLDALDKQLVRNGRQIHANVLRRAMERGGYIARSEVYHVAGYRQTRKLNGFTTPLNTARDHLIGQDVLPVGASNPLEPEYGEGTGFRPALGFNVSPEIMRAYTQGQ